ncbi:hypothetical protein KBB96_09500 [Luteolibacter ambystomatis]|uniref:Uncharacterized protein n=1 Tax=Luteolibacter ambystomatis TaxID=2824561 RepID=A0A975J322_9BACT|nr:hypothetical protein [Luteolibacter ambystomatis]QUE53114.1 hypothetical protein KBB96_09500 [Luteolibacter ambystomatis]
MTGHLSARTRLLLPALLAASITTPAPAVAPTWWSNGTPPVIDPAATPENHGVANIGQAKWVAKNALETLRSVVPDVAEQVEADLVGSGKPLASWDAPVTQAEKDAQRAPLLIGQLKAIAAPFYARIHAVAPDWLATERDYYEMPSTGTFYPWTATTADDQNKAVATIGQLKAVFSLDFTVDRETGADADGLPDLWEYRWFQQLHAAGTGDNDGDGISNADEITNGTDPNKADSDGDGLPDDVDPHPLSPEGSDFTAPALMVTSPLQ